MPSKRTTPASDPEDLTPLIQLLRFRALEQPHRTAYVFLLDGEHRRVEHSYATLETAARRWAYRFTGIAKPGDRIPLLLPPDSI